MPLASYPVQSSDKLRYGDCDPLGHVNNAVFSTFLETGRTELLYTGEEPILDEGCGFVIARMELDFLAEVNWPGTVEIGTRVSKIGRSSITMEQGLFQNGQPVASAVTVVVQMDLAARKPQELSSTARDQLKALQR
jgi:acyl-CoA thioester hydrolase